MLIDTINKTIDDWVVALEHYSVAQLLAKPSPAGWSLGQLYMHLITETRYYMEQAGICLRSGNNSTETMSASARKIFSDNAFPDIIIEGAPDNALLPQPANREQLLQGLQQLKAAINTLAASVLKTAPPGKTKHPGLGYFSANEWLRFAEIHFRHHLRQKQRIDHYLASGNT